jgi:hypothetical protein
MELLDFPPEIFRRIIHNLVNESNVLSSWKLRSVCRKISMPAFAFALDTNFPGTFDQEISENILAIQPQAKFSSPYGYDLLGHPENMKHYLAYHVKNPRDVLPELPAKIQKMVAYITKELQDTDHLKGRNILLEVCAGVAYTFRQHWRDGWYMLLWRDDGLSSQSYGRIFNDLCRKRLADGTEMHDRLIAAASVGAYDVVAELLLHAPASLPQGIFKEPMAAAVLLDDRKMLDVMIGVLDRHSSKTFKKTEVLSETSPYSMLFAMREAILKKSVGMVDLLIGYLHRFMTLPDKKHYRGWIDLAISLPSNDALKSLLQAVPQTKPFHIKPTIFAHGCRSHSSDIVKTLLEHGDIQLDSSSTSMSTLVIAIRFGTISIICAVVEAGADIDMVMDVHRFKYRTTITPLEYAIHLKHTEAMTYLVERGAKLPSPLPSSRMFRKVLQAIEQSKKVK